MTSRKSGHTGPHIAGHTGPAVGPHTAPTQGMGPIEAVLPGHGEVERGTETPKHTPRGDKGGAFFGELGSGTVVITSPIGFPFHGSRLLTSHLTFIERLQPAAVLNIGGLFASHSERRGCKDEALVESVVQEYLSPLRAVYEGPVGMPAPSVSAPIPRQIRPKQSSDASIALMGLLHEFEVAMLPSHLDLVPGWVIACAALGVRRRSSVGATALAEARKLGVNVICGCSGFLGVVSETRGPTEQRQTLHAVEVGRLRAPSHNAEIRKPGFGRGPGFAVLEIEDGVVRPVLIPMKPNGAFSYDGEQFGLPSLPLGRRR
jgi:hypothetical protein